MQPTLAHYLVVAAILFGLGLFTVATRRNAVGMLLGVELILNAGALNFVAFDHFAAEAKRERAGLRRLHHRLRRERSRDRARDRASGLPLAPHKASPPTSSRSSATSAPPDARFFGGPGGASRSPGISGSSSRCRFAAALFCASRAAHLIRSAPSRRAARRVSGSAKQIAILSVGALSLSFGVTVYHACVLASKAASERVLLQHLWNMVRVGQLDASFDLAFDPLSATMALVVTGNRPPDLPLRLLLHEGGPPWPTRASSPG